MRLFVALEKATEPATKHIVLKNNGQGLPHVRKMKFRGIQINIELDAGTTASGKDPNGKPWSVKYIHPYGEIPRTEGNDGDPVDVYVGPNAVSEKVYIVHQLTREGKYDEDKVFLGFDNPRQVKKSYLHHGPPWGFGSIERMTLDEFKHGYLASNRMDGFRKSLSVEFTASYNDRGRRYDFPENGFVRKDETVLRGQELPLREHIVTGRESEEELDYMYASHR